jgi:hypothetical protein
MWRRVALPEAPDGLPQAGDKLETATAEGCWGKHAHSAGGRATWCLIVFTGVVSCSRETIVAVVSMVNSIAIGTHLSAMERGSSERVKLVLETCLIMYG